LKQNYHVLSAQELLAWRAGDRLFPPRSVLLTCDDGLLNCLTDMLPVLRQENLTCLFFVTGASAQEARTMLWYEELLLLFLRGREGRMEISSRDVTMQGELGSRAQRQRFWWSSVKRLSELNAQARESFLGATRRALGTDSLPKLESAITPACRRFGLMNVAELRELASAGMVIGAHTLSHPVLSQASPGIAYTEIEESRARLESSLGTPIWAFAYPFGDAQSVTPAVLNMPREAGFAAAFLNFGGGLGTTLPEYALPRVHVTADMNLSEFEAHVSGFYARLQRGRKRGSQSSGSAALN
jgi:peptidoglycan/xylan/chitin deacetylase (PgdA/CDA1 family)